MGRVRICQLITELRPAGAERCVYELACRLDRSRFDVHVAALRGGRVADWLAEGGVPVTVLGVRSKLDFGKLFALRRLLENLRVDLLHTHLFHADLAGRLAARRATVPHLVHTVHVAEARFRPWQYAWARLAAGRCDQIVCVSRAVRDHHSRKTGLPRSAYQVIYNGIDIAAYARDQRRRQDLRSQWGVRPHEVVVAFVGRLDHQKNVGMFLEAARRVRGAGRAIHAVVAGEGPEAHAVESFLGRSDHSHWARWMGFVEDVGGLLSAVDIFAAPSRWEGLPLAPAEAMAAGLPVVATRVAGMTEVVEPGVTGLLTDSEDVDSFAAAMIDLTDNPRRREEFAVAGRRRVNEHFSIEANVAAHESLYGRVFQGGLASEK